MLRLIKIFWIILLQSQFLKASSENAEVYDNSTENTEIIYATESPEDDLCSDLYGKGELPDYYDNQCPPSSPRVYEFNAYINQVLLDDSKLGCNISLSIRFAWRDTRILKTFQNATRPPPTAYGQPPLIVNFQPTSIWTPLVFMHERGIYHESLQINLKNISTSATIENIFQPEHVGRLDTSIDWNITYVNDEDEHDFRFFPGDTHVCRFAISTSSYNKADYGEITVHPPRYTAAYPNPEDSPLFKGIFVVEKIIIKNKEASEVVVKIVFTRKLGFHIIRTFLPCAFLVGVSWLGLFLPVEVAKDRIALSIGILITITIFSNEIRKETSPPVGYLTMLDAWLLICIILEFLLLLQNILILKITTRKLAPRSSSAIAAMLSAVRTTTGQAIGQPALSLQLSPVPNGLNEIEKDEDEKRMIQLASRIDHYSIIISIILIVGSAFGYWLALYWHKIGMFEPTWKD